MNPNLVRAAKHYLLGLVASSWNGGIGSIAGILGIDAVAMVDVTGKAHLLTPKEMGSAFAGAFVLHAIMWLKKNPIPETYESDPPFPPAKEP